MREPGGRDDLMTVVSAGRAVLLFLSILVTASGALAQPPNLMSNSDFDVDLSDWSIEGGSVVWSPDDANDDPDSGSALLDVSSAATYLAQCIPVEADASYQERVKVRYVAPAQDDEFRLRIFWHDAEFCTIDSIVGLDDGGLIPQNTEWRERSFLRLVAPPDAVSARVDIVALSTSGLGLVHVDEFRLIPGGIFSDGFESGDTLAWQ